MKKKEPNRKTIIGSKISVHVCNTEHPYLNICKNKPVKLEAAPVYISKSQSKQNYI